MSQIPTRTLRDYLSSLPDGSASKVVGQDLTARGDLALMDQAVPLGGTTGQVLTKTSDSDYDVEWTPAGVGDMQKIIYDPQNINADAFDRANQTGTQDASTTITGLGTAAFLDGSTLATLTGTQTLTNKRITKRVITTPSASSIGPDANGQDIIAVTALATNLTINAPTGTPTDGQCMIIRIQDDGTPRTLTWNAAYTSVATEDLRTTTIAGQPMYWEFMFNAFSGNWEFVNGSPRLGLWA
jgi:hypothetical protein